jgi:nitrogen fixation-related uncharacterized protein
MAAYIAIVLSIGILTVLGIAAVLWGVDTRPTYGDDHVR